MSTPRHTPGPWIAHPSDSPDWWLVSAGRPGGRLVANVNCESCPDAASAPAFVQMPAEANARLIAAAPELLGALVGLEDCAAACREFVATPAARAWIKQARSAIARATGTPQ